MPHVLYAQREPNKMNLTTDNALESNALKVRELVTMENVRSAPKVKVLMRILVNANLANN